jgi:hypothetical protein
MKEFLMEVFPSYMLKGNESLPVLTTGPLFSSVLVALAWCGAITKILYKFEWQDKNASHS